MEKLQGRTAGVRETDIDMADEAVEKLSRFTLPKDAAEVFDDLKAAVANLDWDSASEILSGIGIGDERL